MKYYYFNPEGYELEYHVLAASKEDAIEYVIARIHLEYPGDSDYSSYELKNQFNSLKWMIDNDRIEERSIGEVVITERS